MLEKLRNYFIYIFLFCMSIWTGLTLPLFTFMMTGFDVMNTIFLYAVGFGASMYFVNKLESVYKNYVLTVLSGFLFGDAILLMIALFYGWNF